MKRETPRAPTGPSAKRRGGFHPVTARIDRRPVAWRATLCRWAALFALVGTAPGCEQAGLGFRSVTVELAPSPIELDAIGASVQVDVQVIDGRGQGVVGARLTYTTADPTIATVDDAGLVTAVSAGSTRLDVVATGLGFIEARASAAIEVDPVVAALEVLGGTGQSGTVGEPLSDVVRVRATDRLGSGVPGRLVTFDAAIDGGSADPPSATTDPQGVATTQWTLGPLAGPLQQLRAAVDGSEIDAVLIEALGLAGPPAEIEVVAGASQFGVRSTPLPEPVQVLVRDTQGNSIGGHPVDFSAALGGGSTDPATALTDLSGRAETTWLLGPIPGAQTLQVSVGPALDVSVSATATLPPDRLLAASATSIEGVVAAPVVAVPTVRVEDAGGAPVPGTPVSFEVTAGGGSLGGSGSPPSTRITDGAGIATAPSWTLGTTAGTANQVVRATVGQLPPVLFTATARAGPPSQVVVEGGDAQSGAVTLPLPAPIGVRVDDAWGNAAGGVDVHFSPSGGFVTPTSVATDAAGRASAAWTLGPVAGALRLEIRAGGDGGPRGEASATATGTASTCALDPVGAAFSIQICWVGPVDATVADALDGAVSRWEQVIVGDLEDVTPNGNHASCVDGAPWVTGATLDDLVLYVTVAPVDGPGGGLAGALPCFVRASSGLPTFARLRVDRDDVDGLAASGRLVDVVTHEIGHALGFGTLWPEAGLLVDPAAGSTGVPPDTHFAGAGAIAEFDAAGGGARTVGAKVPVQNRGGGGVVDTHWRETVLGNELMTAELNASGPNPLSRVTVASLADLGYAVDADRSDAYVVPFPNFPSQSERSVPIQALQLLDDIWWGPIGVVDAAGSVVAIHRPLPNKP